MNIERNTAGYFGTMLCLWLILQSVWGHSQPYQVGHLTLSLIDSSRNNRSVPAEVYYPSLMAGEQVPVAPGQFPVLSYGHGFVMGVDAYTNFSLMLVPQGYIFILPNTETGLSPSHLDLALDLSFIIHTMALANNDPGSLFYGAVDPHSAVMGHSMGGGASILAAGDDPAITAVVNFAAANTNPSAISAAAGIEVPALLFAGSEDCVTPPAQQQEIMYDSLASACKTLISITGGGHCYFADYNFLCTLGENSCSPNLTINREEQQDVTFDLLIPWLNCFLKGNTPSFGVFTDSLFQSSRITFQHLCESTRVPERRTGSQNMRIFPVPFREHLYLEGDDPLSDLRIVDITGRVVFSMKLGIERTVRLSLGFLDTGVYQLLFIDNKGLIVNRKICKY